MRYVTETVEEEAGQGFKAGIGRDVDPKFGFEVPDAGTL
jgi:hypothetical protein